MRLWCARCGHDVMQQGVVFNCRCKNAGLDTMSWYHASDEFDYGCFYPSNMLVFTKEAAQGMMFKSEGIKIWDLRDDTEPC